MLDGGRGLSGVRMPVVNNVRSEVENGVSSTNDLRRGQAEYGEIRKSRSGVMVGGEVESVRVEKKRNVILNFDRADLNEVCGVIFKEWLKKNYVLDNDVAGLVSVYIDGDYDAGELFGLVVQAFRSNGLVVYERSGMVHIRKLDKEVGDGFGLRSGPNEGGVVVVGYRGRFMKVERMVEVVRSLIGRDRQVSSDEGSNSVVWLDEVVNGRAIVGVLKALDVDVLKEISLRVVRVGSVGASEAVKYVRGMIDGVLSLKESRVSGDVVMIPVDRVNVVLVLSKDDGVLMEVEKWIRAVDVEQGRNGEQVWVYKVRNAEARQLVNMVKGVYGAEVSGVNGGSAEVSGSELKGNEKEVMVSNGKSVGRVAGMTGELNLVADDRANSVLVRANAGDYERVRRLLEELDQVGRAVMVETYILEVTLKGDLEYGVQWYFKSGNLNVLEGVNAGSLGSLVASGGMKALFSAFGGDLKALVTALSSKTEVRVLSCPSVVVQDGKEATIKVGGRQPVPTATVVNSSSTTSSIDYADIGVSLKVKAHVNSGGVVRLGLEQAVRQVESEKVVVGDGATAPSFTERSVVTEVLARDGSTVVIGGLIGSTVKEERAGVPVLQDIPVIGWLADSRMKKSEKVELMVAVTPHVLEGGSVVMDEAVARLRKVLGAAVEGGV